LKVIHLARGDFGIFEIYHNAADMQTKLLLLLLLFVGGMMASGQPKKDKLAAVMQTYHSYNMFDGAVLVAENGRVVYKGW
jgi:hypothetical protein